MKQDVLNLEVFEIAHPDLDAPLLDAFQAEKLRESAYEQGYAAGWQDALEHMRSEDALRRIAAQEAVQAIGFSYNEAHQALTASFLALTQAFVDTVMPEATRLALPLYLAAELDALLEAHTRPQVQILCAPYVLGALREVVAAAAQSGVELVAEPSFSDAQVSLRIGTQERVIDLDDILSRLRDIVTQNQIRQPEQETAYGRA